jgi:hypothetical protein
MKTTEIIPLEKTEGCMLMFNMISISDDVGVV